MKIIKWLGICLLAVLVLAGLESCSKEEEYNSRLRELILKDMTFEPNEVVLNTKTRQLFVKLCNASAEAKTAHLDLSRFNGMKPVAEKSTISGQPNDENNYEQQPIAPVKETIKMKKRMDMELAPYSFTMITIQL